MRRPTAAWLTVSREARTWINTAQGCLTSPVFLFLLLVVLVSIGWLQLDRLNALVAAVKELIP